jgi:hypothetical protein
MAFLSRITRLHIIAATGVVFVALLVAFSLTFLQPTLRQIKDVKAQQAAQEKTWSQLPAKVAALSQANKNLVVVQAQANAMLARQPKISTQPFDAMFDLYREYTFGTGPALYRFFLSKGYAPQGIALPATAWTPQLVPPLLVIPMTGFSIRARSFPAVINFLRQLKEMPRIGVIGGVTIRGTSPNLEVAMPLTVYIMTQTALAPQSQAAALAALAAAKGAKAAPGAAGARGGGAMRFRMGGRR